VSAGGRLQCAYCGAWDVKGKSFTVTTHAMHETLCPEAPHHVPGVKKSGAWNPMPWGHSATAGVPSEKEILFIGGPNAGTKLGWVVFLMDGTTVSAEPPEIYPGPVVTDSAGRKVSKYMGHYVLALVPKGEALCPVYEWVDTITKKPRLPKAQTFTEAWPDLAQRLQGKGQT
jgi:hypothetical protein